MFCDRVQIQQVLLNLMRNGIEAMADSEARELLIATTVDSAGDALVSVRDTGAGIADDVMSQLFQPFMTTKAEGMGVGLSISRSIIENHGGRIWAEPNRPSGAVFKFTLPLAHEEGPNG